MKTVGTFPVGSVGVWEGSYNTPVHHLAALVDRGGEGGVVANNGCPTAFVMSMYYDSHAMGWVAGAGEGKEEARKGLGL